MPTDRPLKRNFVHVDDLVAAILLALERAGARQRLYNVAMDEPVDYGVVAEHLGRTRGLPAIDIPSGFHSTWLDNTPGEARTRLAAGLRHRPADRRGLGPCPRGR